MAYPGQSAARKYSNGLDLTGPGRTPQDSDLWQWTPVDVLPPVCKQGQGFESPWLHLGKRQTVIIAKTPACH